MGQGIFIVTSRSAGPIHVYTNKDWRGPFFVPVPTVFFKVLALHMSKSALGWDTLAMQTPVDAARRKCHVVPSSYETSAPAQRAVFCIGKCAMPANRTPTGAVLNGQSGSSLCEIHSVSTTGPAFANQSGLCSLGTSPPPIIGIFGSATGLRAWRRDTARTANQCTRRSGDWWRRR